MAFEFYTAGRIVFGRGELARLSELTRPLGSRVLLMVGGRSVDDSALAACLSELLAVEATARCAREPRVEDVDAAVAAGKQARCDLVVALGGGSVIDCGKAVAGMMTNPGSLVDYLEGVGKGLAIEVEPLPMIAVPTTAGTGSEVTKNAVITGPGYKKSVRSPKLIPDVALVDPDLTLSLPPHVTASCGMDALTQLVESYLSRNASPLTDGLCLEGLRVAGQALERVYHQPDDADAREQMALASLVGGICLANAGLGAVHGFASPLGALFPIPHGVACAALLPQVVRANLAAARGSQVEGRVCVRAARIGEAITGVRYSSNEEAAEAAVVRLEEIQRELAIPRLGTLGLEERDIPRLVAGSRGSSMRYNPVDLTDEQLDAALRSAW